MPTTPGGQSDSAAPASRDDAAQPAVVVIGGSRGIGRAVAFEFARRGRSVALVARNKNALEEAASRIRTASSVGVVTIVCDATATDAYTTIDTQLAAHGFTIDVLVNSAALGLAGPFITHDEHQLDELIALNVAALTRMTRQALPPMLTRGRGGIINFASLGAYVPGPHQAAYYASKAYVLSLTEAIAAECTGRGVRICAVAPGPVDTAFHQAMGADQANYRLFLADLSADAVARSVYRNFVFRRRVILPGLSAPLLAVALKLLPHRISVPIVSWLLKLPSR